MGEITSDTYRVNVGIPQGSPLSPILYLFYNADLLEMARSKDVQTSGWIDDVYLFTRSASTERNCQNLERAHQAAETWAKRHGSKFSPIKYQLIHFTRSKTNTGTTKPVNIAGTVVQPTETAMYLGVVLDSALRWEHQFRHIQKQATPALAPLATLAGTTWGAGLTQLRKVYQAAVVPAMLYGCSAWYSLRSGGGHPQSRLKTLSQIQTRAARVITGAFRATASAALNIEAHLLPMQRLLERKMIETFLRFHTGTAMDMVGNVRRGEDIGNGHIGNGWRPWSWSPLEKIQDFTEKEMGEDSLRNLEQILPFSVAPHWASPDVIIEGDAETAIEAHRAILNRAPRPIALYTDGSGINGRVGAAAICPKYQISRSSYMGQQSESTVYVAELQGILLALVIILQRQMQHAVIFTDNQATLQALRNPGSQSGQYILEAIIMALNKGRKAG
jgi:hypothetical protein